MERVGSARDLLSEEPQQRSGEYQGYSLHIRDEAEQPVGVLSTIYDRDDSSKGAHEGA